MIHEIDEHLDNVPLIAAKKKINFNDLLKGILPILEFVVPVLFFKPKWQTYLRAFIAAAHVVTPETFETEADFDGDGIPDSEDLDDDNDGIEDGLDSDPHTPPPPPPHNP